jgi:hypothetical protein
MDLAKEMTKEALPIKCLEAVILGMYPSTGPRRDLLVASASPGLHFLLWKGRAEGDPGSPHAVQLYIKPLGEGAVPRWRGLRGSVPVPYLLPSQFGWAALF